MLKLKNLGPLCNIKHPNLINIARGCTIWRAFVYYKIQIKSLNKNSFFFLFN